MSDQLKGERRQVPRIELIGELEFIVDTVPIPARYYNLSVKGLYLRSVLTPAPGTRIRLALSLPKTGQRLEVSGRVVWEHQDYAVGVEFDQLTPPQQSAITRALLETIASA